MKASTAFDILYGDHVQNDNTIVCNRCGYTLYGDDPQIHVTCINCLKQFENGVILRDGVVSLEAAVELEIDFALALQKDPLMSVEFVEPIDGYESTDQYIV